MRRRRRCNGRGGQDNNVGRGGAAERHSRRGGEVGAADGDRGTAKRSAGVDQNRRHGRRCGDILIGVPRRTCSSRRGHRDGHGAHRAWRRQRGDRGRVDDDYVGRGIAAERHAGRAGQVGAGDGDRGQSERGAVAGRDPRHGRRRRRWRHRRHIAVDVRGNAAPERRGDDDRHVAAAARGGHRRQRRGVDDRYLPGSHSPDLHLRRAVEIGARDGDVGAAGRAAGGGRDPRHRRRRR